MSSKTIPNDIAIAASNYACKIATRQPLPEERAIVMVNSAINGSVMRGVWSEAVCAFVAGYEFSKPYRDRIAELEAELVRLRPPNIQTEHGFGSGLPCHCPASSEYDPPCPRHGVLGIGVTGRD
jgi:hypothetical protein